MNDGFTKWRTAALAAAVAAGVCAGEFRMASLVVPKGGGDNTHHPVTEIAVAFGDVAELSPWHVRRRYPRHDAGEHNGKVVTVREALLAVNDLVAQDQDMPERTFEFADDGSLTAVCDVSYAHGEAHARVDGVEKTLVASVLDAPVRDFGKIEFCLSGHAGGAAVAPDADAQPHVTGDLKKIVLPGGVEMEMIYCAPGSFMMGSPENEDGRFEDEPLHHVTLTKGFWLGKYEVTQEQWESVMGENRSRFKNPNRPVENVSWEDCRRFVDRCNVTLGGIARMPTEAEWEYACRAGSGQPVAGNGRLGDMAWYDGNSGNQTHEVGKNQPNDWGFFDMHGNVLEWCKDWFARPDGVAIDPEGPPTGAFRVLRGGCWFYYARDCRSAYRLKRDPGIRNCIFGFRLACSDKQK